MKKQINPTHICLSVFIGAVFIGGVYFSSVYFGASRPVYMTVHGLNEAQWLQLLKSNTNSLNNPLQILKIEKATVENSYDYFDVEVPLLYNALIRHDFFEGNCSIKIFINKKDNGRIPFVRSINGNCNLLLFKKDLCAGTNLIQVGLWISDAGEKGRRLELVGPITEFIVK
jgi:hypothetical protein